MLGNDQSVITTVDRRYGKTLESIMDIRSIVEDVRAEVLGAIKTGLQIFEMAVIPFILYNSEIWDSIPKVAIEKLEKIQLLFLRILLKTPKTTPIQSLLWETGSLDMESRINIRKLNFYHHILNLDDDAVAKQLAKSQVNNNFPGLMDECKTLLRKYDIEDEPTKFTKIAWKKKVKDSVTNIAAKNILNKMKKYKKIDFEKKVEEKFELKEYMKTMNLHRARTKFSIETKMMPQFKFNYMSVKEYEKSNWSCNFCMNTLNVYRPDSLAHALDCNEYIELRNKFNIEEEVDMLDYYSTIVCLRNDLTSVSQIN